MCFFIVSLLFFVSKAVAYIRILRQHLPIVKENKKIFYTLNFINKNNFQKRKNHAMLDT